MKLTESAIDLSTKVNKINQKTMQPIRQGDVILTPAEQIQGQKQPHLTLAESEVTEHSHRIIEGEAELYEKDGTLYLRVLSPTALLSHEEHHAIAIPEGNWMVRIQRKYEPEVQRALIQGIGYDRIWQELEATELDTWREYTLLKIDCEDDFNEDGQPLPFFLLKMTCPSTGQIHALRVPPDVRSSSRASLTAKEAICWVNWGIAPAEFSVQT